MNEIFQTDTGSANDGVKAISMSIGKKRHEQQDAVAFGHGYLVVADGMGGHPDGADASLNAVKGAVSVLDRESADPSHAFCCEVAEAAEEAVDEMHKRKRYGMSPWNWPATTLLFAIALESGGAVVANLGDSRAYVLEGSVLRQVTVDHENWDGSVTRAIGFGHETPDTFAVSRGRLLLATDGLWLELDHDRITGFMMSPDSDEVVADRLVRAAADAGGRDNVSVGVWSL